MSSKKISKVSKIRLTVFGSLCVLIIIYFFFSLIYNLYTIYSLSNKKVDLENNYKQLQQEAENLKIDIEKLNDSKYLADFAREKYLYSKDGEYIIQMGEKAKETTETIESINTQINKNYIIITISGITLILFIIITNKNKKSKKRKL